MRAQSAPRAPGSCNAVAHREGRELRRRGGNSRNSGCPAGQLARCPPVLTLLLHHGPQGGPHRHAQLEAAGAQHRLPRRQQLAQPDGCPGVQRRGAQQQQAGRRLAKLATQGQRHGQAQGGLHPLGIQPGQQGSGVCVHAVVAQCGCRRIQEAVNVRLGARRRQHDVHLRGREWQVGAG